MYNKRKYLKANNKKILHKVKKQWVTISLALLMLIGGGAVASHISVSADTTNNTRQVSIPQSAAPQQQSKLSTTSSVSTSSASSSSTYNSSSNSTSSSSNNINKLGRGFGIVRDSNIKTGTYDGLHYNYNPTNSNVEFTGGNLTWNGDNSFHAFIGWDSTAPSELQNAKSIKFDNTIDTSNLHNMNNMFCGAYSLQSLDLGNNFDTSNVTAMPGVFSNDFNLRYLNLGNKFDTRNTVGNLWNMYVMFKGTNNLQTLIISNPNTTFNAYADIPALYLKGTITAYGTNGANTGTFTALNPLTDPAYNQNIHYTAPQGSMGDVETLMPSYNGRKVANYKVYTMYAPYGGADSQWGRFQTNDFSHFSTLNNTDSSDNVALPQLNGNVAPDNIHETPWGSAVSGSIINNNGKLTYDKWGNAINSNAELAYFTGNNSDVWLTYSNNGRQFRPYSDTSVIHEASTGISGDFRDPFIMQNPVHNNEWDAYIAGGFHSKMFVFTSTDGINWHRDAADDINLIGSGCAETPDIKMLNGQPIMLTSCQPNKNGVGQVYYTPGHFNNNGIFVSNDNQIHILDSGMDNYAANYVQINPNTIAGIGRLQDWGYSPKGNVRHLSSYNYPRILQKDGNSINVTPVEPGAIDPENSQNLNAGGNLTITPNKKLSLNFGTPTSQFTISLKRQDSDNDVVTYTLNNGALNMNRYDNNLTAWQNMSNSADLGTNQISNIEFYLDNDSIEAYIPEIHKIFTWANYTSTRNANYQMTTNVPVQTNVYGFNLNQAPQLGNINSIISEYSADKAESNKDMSVLNGHTNDSVNNSNDLLGSYFGDIQNAINDANTNIAQINNYNGDARQHVFIALANNDMDIANTKLYQASLQLKNLDNIATPYLDASASDTRIANYYKNSVANSVAKVNQQAAQNAAHAADENIINQQKASVANSVNAANQQKANQAARQADQRIAQQQRTSVANSVAVANRAKANHAAQVADQNTLNQQKQSVANSVNAANQRTATSAANSADKSIESSIANSYAKSADNSIVNSYRNSASASVSAANSSYVNTAAGKAAAKSGASSANKSIESSIANSYAKSADTSIANSYKNSVDNSVRAANQSKANSAAKSADTSIANSASQSADQSIANSEAKNASQQISSQSQQPVAPFIPMDNVIPTPTAITSNSVTNNSNNDNVMNNNSSDLNSSVATSSNVSKNVKHRASKPVMKKLTNNQIPLLGLAKRTYFYQHDEAFVFTNRMKKRTNVLQATVWPNHHVVYRVRIGKQTGYMYGYLKELAKPELFTKRNMYIHVGKRMIKLPMKRLNRIKINHAVRYAGKNYMKYYVNYGRKRGVIYGKLPKITKRVCTNKGTYSKYYQVIPKRYHYVNVKKPLLIYNNKHFTKRNHRGSMRKDITVRVKRLVRDGKMTRFELMNGRYITGLRSFVKLVK